MKLTNAEKDVIQERELREIMNDAILTRKTYKDLRDVRFSTGTKFRSYLERAYGSILTYGEIHGLDVEYMVSKNTLTVYRLSKITKEEVAKAFVDLAHSSEELLTESLIKASNDGEFLLAAIQSYFGGINNISIETNTPIKLNNEVKRKTLEKDIVSDHLEGLSINAISLKYDIHHSTVITWLEDNGIEVKFHTREYLPKERVDEFLKVIIEESRTKKLTNSFVRDKYREEYLSILHYYGNLTEALIQSKEYLLDSSFYLSMDDEFLFKQIRLGYALGKPLNSEYLNEGFGKGINWSARRRFGSWRKAVELAGVEYVYSTSAELSIYGHEFERVVREILTEIGVSFVKCPHDKLQPDFVTDAAWIDAKLSEYTYRSGAKSGVTCVEKYEPHCDALEIVYLRGSGKTRKITDKTTLVFVGDYVNRLPKERQQYYNDLLSEIEAKANGIVYEVGA